MRHTRPSNNRKAGERGSTVLESVLVVIISLVLMIGILDFGQIMFMHQTIMNRVRTVARQSAVQNYTVDAIKNMIVYNTTAPTDQSTGLFGMSTSNVTVAYADASSSEQRLFVSVTDLDYRTYTPLFAMTLKNMPIRLSVSTEQP